MKRASSKWEHDNGAEELMNVTGDGGRGVLLVMHPSR